MANLSCASGYLTLTTATKEDLKDLIFLHVLSEKNAYYDTTIDGIEFLEPTIEDYEHLDVRIDEHKDEEVITDDSYQVTFMFYANGRQLLTETVIFCIISILFSFSCIF